MLRACRLVVCRSLGLPLQLAPRVSGPPPRCSSRALVWQPKAGTHQPTLHPAGSTMLAAAAGPSSNTTGSGSSGGGAREEAALKWEREGTAINASSLRHGPGLLLFWGSACGAAAYVAVARQGIPPDLLLLVGATFWLSIVSSISLTEAWVKFRAPLLERWVGVDVGRRVFRAQYAIEGALAASACGLLYAQAGSAAGVLALLQDPPGRLLAAAGALLLLDVAAVFPALDLRGRQLISSAAQPASLSPRQQAYVAALKADVAGRASPPAQLHILSVLLAFARAGLLGAYNWALLQQLATG